MASDEPSLRNSHRADDARRWIALFLSVCAAIGGVLLIVALWSNRYDPELTKLVTEHFPAIIGLPFCAVAAFVIVTFFRQNESPIEFKMLGVELKGASGEIVLWAFVYLSLVLSLKLMWNP